MEEAEVEKYENTGNCNEQSYNNKDDYLDMNYGFKR